MPGVTLEGSNQALDNSLNTILAEFNLLLDDKGVAKNSASHYTLKAHEGDRKNILNYGRVQAFSVPNGVDIAQSQQLSDAITSYQPSEAAVQVVLGGRTMRRVADPDLYGRTGRIAANAYDLFEDKAGLTQLASFTGSATIGGAGTVASPGIVAAGATRLSYGDNRANPEPAPKPWYGILHPNAILPLWGRMIPLATTPAGTTAYGVNTGAHAGVSIATGASPGSEEMMKRGIGAVGMVAGLTIKSDSNFTVDTNDDFTGAFFSEEGFVYVSEEEARLDPDRSDKSMRGAVELNFWGSFTYGNYRIASYGIPTTLDASTPTS